jgi:hypothetical protein
VKLNQSSIIDVLIGYYRCVTPLLTHEIYPCFSEKEIRSDYRIFCTCNVLAVRTTSSLNLLVKFFKLRIWRVSWLDNMVYVLLDL